MLKQIPTYSFRILFLSTILPFCFVCKAQQSGNKKANETGDFYTVLKKHFAIIDEARLDTSNIIETENKKILKTIEFFKQDIINASDTSDYDLIYLSKSADKKFCIVSWDTRMGGTMIRFAAMAIYLDYANNIHTKLLNGDIDDDIGELMHFDEIFSIKINNDVVYLALGFGQGSTALPWQELKAFKIQQEKLTNPKIFPNKKSELWVEFDLNKFTEGQRVPIIKVKDKGTSILFPIATDEEGFAGKYQILKLDHFTYKVKQK